MSAAPNPPLLPYPKGSTFLSQLMISWGCLCSPYSAIFVPGALCLKQQDANLGPPYGLVGQPSVALPTVEPERQLTPGFQARSRGALNAYC